MNYRNDARPGANRLQQEAILSGRTAQRNGPCPECGLPTDVYPLRSHQGCTGRACTARQACGWEGEPLATLDCEGRLVKTDALGRPTTEVLFDPRSVAGACGVAA